MERDIASLLDVDTVEAVWRDAGSELDATARLAATGAVVRLIADADLTGDELADAVEEITVPLDEVRLLRVALRDRVDAADVPADLHHRVGVVLDELVVSEARRRISTLEETALLDPLTGLANRRAASQAFERALAHARRHSRPIAVATADLIGLKQINDAHGHAAGDDALRRFSAALLGSMRAGDTAYRFGGDEFVVLAPDTTGQDLAHLFDRIRDRSPAFSVGIAEAPRDGDSAEALLAVADQRMYSTRRAVSTVAPRRRRPAALVAALPVLGLLAVLGARLLGDAPMTRSPAPAATSDTTAPGRSSTVSAASVLDGIALAPAFGPPPTTATTAPARVRITATSAPTTTLPPTGGVTAGRPGAVEEPSTTTSSSSTSTTTTTTAPDLTAESEDERRGGRPHRGGEPGDNRRPGHR